MISCKTKVVDGRSSCAAQAVDFVRKRLARRMTPQAICEAMCDHCLAPDTQACLSPVSYPLYSAPCPLSLYPVPCPPYFVSWPLYPVPCPSCLGLTSLIAASMARSNQVSLLASGRSPQTRRMQLAPSFI